MARTTIRVLLVEDDEDDYILVRDLLAEVPHVDYSVEWASSPEQALGAFERPAHDACLLDYRLGERSGIDLLYEAMGREYRVPIIFLTGHGDLEVDAEALRAGAADFLTKGEISCTLLDRSIRYAIRQRQVLENLRESEGRCRLLSTELLSAQETERRNIAREIHDSIGQTLAATRYLAGNALDQLGRGAGGEAAATLERIVAMLGTITDETRRIQMDLRPSMLDDIGIAAALEWFCREFQKTYATISVEPRITIEEEQVPQTLKINLFRIIQEAFNNVSRHSQADRVDLTLEHDDGAIALIIRDDGQGFDPEEARRRYRKGMGLSSMKERADLTGGTFGLRSEPGKGTTLSFTWPLREKPDA